MENQVTFAKCVKALAQIGCYLKENHIGAVDSAAMTETFARCNSGVACGDASPLRRALRATSPRGEENVKIFDLIGCQKCDKRATT